MKILITLTTILGILGIYVSYKIRKNKKLHKQGQVMVCLPGHKCDAVIFSDYSKFFGINLEVLGFIYYFLTFLIYLTYLTFPQLISTTILFISFGLSFGGFLFSIYLTYIQIFKLKSLCSWCLLSALASTLIFFLIYSISVINNPALIPYIESLAPFIKSFEFITLILGIAVFTTLEILTLKFLRDYKITLAEEYTLKIFSQFAWFTLFLYILNNVGIYLPQYLISNISNIFYIELGLIVLIIINTAISYIQILPELKDPILNEGKTVKVSRLKKYKYIATSQSIISLISWYSLFILNYLI
jgi:uncharacterized membrane protein